MYKITVDRSLTPQQALDKLGFTQYVDKDILKTMPIFKTKEVEIEFFKLDEYHTTEEANKEYNKRGLIPDPLALIALLTEQPDILDEKKWIAVQWDDKSYAAFDRWDAKRIVDVNRYDFNWDDYWWFAGVGKSLGNLETKALVELGLLERIKILEDWKLKIDKIIEKE